LDEKGRPYPCVDYFYDEDGFDDVEEEELPECRFNKKYNVNNTAEVR
jgi:hypothetical protein